MATLWKSPLPDIDTTPALLHDEILGRARQWPERIALIDAGSGRRLTYGELEVAIRWMAGGLRFRGAQPGDAVALVAGSMDYAIALHAALVAGLVVAPISPMSTVRELAGALRRVDARCMLADPAALPVAAEAASSSGVKAVLTLNTEEGAASTPSPMAAKPLPPHDGDPHSTALVFSTSGTGGLPKSAAHTHAGAVAGLRQFASGLMRFAAGDVVSGMLLFPHLMGTMVLNHTLRSGARFVTLPTFDFDQFLRAVQDHRVTVAIGPPPLALSLARDPRVERYDLSSLRLVAVSGAATPVAVQRACELRIGCVVGQGYGMTEAWMIAGPEDERAPHGSVGQLGPCVDAVIVDPDDGTRLDAGQTGELWVRGPQLMRGYAGDDEATAATIDDDGWLHTGDLAYFDADGYLFLVDRLKELIKHRGYQVPPAELEHELTAHPAVVDAVVVPRLHPEAGEVPVAHVVLQAAARPDDIAEWLAARVAPWKRLWDIVIVDQIPRTPAGKLLRRQAAQQERNRAGQQ